MRDYLDLWGKFHSLTGPVPPEVYRSGTFNRIAWEIFNGTGIKMESSR